MSITSAQYKTCTYTNENGSIEAIIHGVKWSVPLDPANRHYAEIMRQVAAGQITIAEAD